jgi:hypothetical protein
MPIHITEYTPEWRRSVQEFNGRLDRAGVPPGLRLPEDSADRVLLPGSQIYVAVDGEMVRGAFILRPQQFSFRGEARRVAHYRLPLSEGLIDRKFAMLAPAMLRRALQAEPLLYALGMGGYDRPLPRMLAAMGWRIVEVPFFFRVVRGRRFLRGMPALRRSPFRAAAMETAAWLGAGVSIAVWQRLRTRVESPVVAKEMDDFGGWADEIWDVARGVYGMAAVRDAATLSSVYSGERFLRLRVGTAGWAVVIDTVMREDPYFGNLRVGTIVDALAKPEYAAAVVHAARVYLERRGVDLIISNQAHLAWRDALRADGFFSAPSNFLFAASKGLSAAIGSAEVHVNRGDGDGPVNL